MEQPSPANILRAIETLRATTMFVPPTIIYMMLEEADIGKRDLSSLRHFIVGGASIRPDVVARAMPIFNHAMEACFGQTEVPQIAICMRAKDWQDPKNHASTGQPTFLTQVGIMDKYGALLPAGIVSGFLGSVTTIYGFPSLQVILASQCDKEEIAFLFSIFLASGHLALWRGMVLNDYSDPEMLQWGLIACVPMFFALLAGRIVHKKLSVQAFRKAVNLVLLLAGLGLILKSL